MKMRDIINLIEMFDLRAKGSAYWVNPETKQIIDTAPSHHTEYVLYSPEKFGLTVDQLKRIEGADDSLDHEQFVDWMHEKSRTIHSSPTLKAAIRNGWVRVVVTRRRNVARPQFPFVEVALDGPKEACRAALKLLMDQGIEPTSIVTQGAVIEWDAVEEFVKTGRIISDRRGSIDEDASSLHEGRTVQVTRRHFRTWACIDPTRQQFQNLLMKTDYAQVRCILGAHHLVIGPSETWTHYALDCWIADEAIAMGPAEPGFLQTDVAVFWGNFQRMDVPEDREEQEWFAEQYAPVYRKILANPHFKAIYPTVPRISFFINDGLMFIMNPDGSNAIGPIDIELVE